MKTKIYKALDKPSSLFGLKGSYIRFAIIGLVAALILGLLVGRALNGLLGVGVFAGAAMGVYLGVLMFQSKYPERERKRWMCSKKIPDFVSVPPKSFRSYLVPGLKPRKP